MTEEIERVLFEPENRFISIFLSDEWLEGSETTRLQNKNVERKASSPSHALCPLSSNPCVLFVIVDFHLQIESLLICLHPEKF
jgi:hypothetical protein